MDIVLSTSDYILLGCAGLLAAAVIGLVSQRKKREVSEKDAIELSKDK